jgi:hypothetical protein
MLTYGDGQARLPFTWSPGTLLRTRMLTYADVWWRAGAFAIYLEPWHAEIFDFLELKKNSGSEELRVRYIVVKVGSKVSSKQYFAP